MSAGQARDTVEQAVAVIAPLLATSFRDPWWIIGSAALHLAGAGSVVVHDIDVLASERDAVTFIELHSELLEHGYRPVDDGHFRSRFARFGFSPLPAEVMGGLQVSRDGAWLPVRIEATCVIDCAGHAVPVPTPAEQLRLFEWFGRAKDLDKARRLRDHMRSGILHVA